MVAVSLLRIGDLARLGGVSVRMLRHYHEIELLIPEHVDPITGYRSYESAQLEILGEIVALKDLGCSLAEIHEIVNGQRTVEQIVELLTVRRDQAAAEAVAARATVVRIDAHIDALVAGATAATAKRAADLEVEIKAVGSRRVAQLSAVAESWAPTDIGPVIRPLYPELIARMQRAGVEVTGPSTAWYEDSAEGRVVVHATLGIGERPEGDGAPPGFDVAELTGLPRVASTIHRGTMDNCDTTYQALLEWIERNGHRPVGYGREVDIECGPDQPWITEIQIAIEPDEEPAH